jgi:hypothetical protein
MTESEPVAIDLTDEERRFMYLALYEFFGPASGQPVMITALRLSGRAEFDNMVKRLGDAIEQRKPLSEADWARALFLTEVSWASNLVGSGLDFATSFRDEKAVQLLRSIQRKTVRHAIGVASLIPENVDRGR